MSTTPLVSLIVPVYNAESFLDDCMRSILKQTYNNLEIILIDDGSTDASPKMCDAYAAEDTRVLVIHKEHGGLSAVRNHGINEAAGEFIVFIDSDDTVDEDYISYLYGLITKYNTSMSICQHRVISNDRVIHEYGSDGDECLTSKTCLTRMLYHDVIDTSAWSKMYRRELFDGVSYPEGRRYEDIATTYKLMVKCDNIAVGYESKYSYAVHVNSIVNAPFEKYKLDMLDMTDDMGTNVLKIYPDLDKAVMRRRVYSRFSTLNQMLHTDEYPEVREEIISFIKTNGKEVVKGPLTPRRDKIAYTLLKISFPLYRFVWDKAARRNR